MRSSVLFLSLCLLGGTALAAPDWQACRQIDDDRKRLACYDDHARMLEKKNAPPTAEERKAAFGLPAVTPAEEIHDIQAGISKVEKHGRGQRVLYLDNGQAWRQVGSSSQPRLKAGDQVVIERGALGSYILKPANSNRSMRVKRLR
ncbi:hypothetical protein [Thiolapillus sp.]